MQIINQDVGIGHNIQAMRKDRGLTQVEVTAKMQVLGCSISRTTYTKIEREWHNIKVSDLVALQHILGCSFDDFFDGLKLK